MRIDMYFERLKSVLRLSTNVEWYQTCFFLLFCKSTITTPRFVICVPCICTWQLYKLLHLFIYMISSDRLLSYRCVHTRTYRSICLVFVGYCSLFQDGSKSLHERATLHILSMSFKKQNECRYKTNTKQ